MDDYVICSGRMSMRGASAVLVVTAVKLVSVLGSSRPSSILHMEESGAVCRKECSFVDLGTRAPFRAHSRSRASTRGGRPRRHFVCHTRSVPLALTS